MKHLFYTILLVTSLGIAGAIWNPALVQQGADLIGLKLPQNSADSTGNAPDEDQLAQFLAQYPFARNQNNAETVSTGAIPLAVIPEPAPPPIPSVYTAMPAVNSVPAPQPASEPISPAYSSSWEHSRWNGEVTAPVTDWSGPSQPYQEPVPVPQQSIYVAPPANNPPPSTPNAFAPSQETFPVVNDPSPVGFEQTRYMPPVTQPILPPHGTLQTPAVLIEDVPVYGTEMVARVGTQVILMGDILPKLRRAAQALIAENFKRMSEEDRAKVAPGEVEQVINMFIESHYPEFLQEQILVALVFNDYAISKSKAEKDFLNEKMGEEFDRAEIPELMKEFNVDNVAALKKYLETQLGSSLDRERRLWIREQIVRQWIGLSVQRATGECTADEMREFYEQNKEMFTSSAKVRWQEMVVLLSHYGTEQEALNKIRWMGNQVAGGAPFEEIAKAHSDGFTASKGGVWDWTEKGSLTSAALEQAMFSQPIGQLSSAIIRSDKGLHIIRVLERKEVNVVSFVEAQGTIREKIRNQRVQRYQAEYFSDLRRRFPAVVVKERIDFNVNSPRTANTAW